MTQKPIPFIDIHTHNRLFRKGVIALYSQRIGFEDVIELPCGVKMSAGIHPWDVENLDAITEMAKLQSLDLTAVGEIGLDYFRDTSRILQVDLFERQLQFASDRKLPVILHCVRAIDDLLAILNNFPSIKGVVFHGFRGNVEQAKQLVQQNIYISLGDSILSSNKASLILNNMPTEMLFFESDDWKGDIIEIYKFASSSLSIDIEILKNQILSNYNQLLSK